ncbi:MAG: hypothetical protein SFT90_06450 [Rickettsiales bacterium]|nr:hypothetical protein [Rickettsiales bacterium]
MYKILLPSLLALSLSSCSFFNSLWDTSEEWGKKMPVKQGVERCEDGVTCFRKRQPEQQSDIQQPPQNQNWVQPQTIEQPSQNQQGYIPTSLPGQKGDEPNMYDEMSKKLPPDMQENPNKEAYEAYQKGLMQAGQQQMQQPMQQTFQQPIQGQNIMPTQTYQGGYPQAPANIRFGN